MFVENSSDVRAFFIGVRTKMENRQVLEPLEAMIADVIEHHPEYDEVLSDPDKAMSDDFLARHYEINPFLHLGLHIALREQLQADRPAGVARIFADCRAAGRDDRHTIEHKMMGCLSKALAEAQRSGSMPDEDAYLECLRSLS